MLSIGIAVLIGFRRTPAPLSVFLVSYISQFLGA
jgi:hypothetical protein